MFLNNEAALFIAVGCALVCTTSTNATNVSVGWGREVALADQGGTPSVGLDFGHITKSSTAAAAAAAAPISPKAEASSSCRLGAEEGIPLTRAIMTELILGGRGGRVGLSFLPLRGGRKEGI
jgi:hypothetical protein